MKRKLILCLFVASLFIFSGCGADVGGGTTGQEHDAPSAAETTVGGVEAGYPVTFVDSLGLEVSITAQPQRIVSLAPAITEILFAIGAGDNLVGVTDFCDYPAAALAKTRLGGFKDPNVELVIAQNPDLIFVAAGIQEGLIQKFEALGIQVVALDAETLEQVLTNILLAGMVVGRAEAAGEVVADLEARIEAVQVRVSASSVKPTVFFEIWGDPLITAGPDSFIDDLINLAGGVNIAQDLQDRFARFSLEILLERDPDLYIVQDHAHDPTEVMARPGFAGLTAVKEGRVAAVQDDLVTLPGPRLVEGLEEIARIIHPEQF